MGVFLHFGLRGCTARWGDVVLENERNILFIQTDKLTVDRATTHGMLGAWNREFIYENKEIQEERNPVNVCTEKNAQGSCWHQTLHFIWRSTTSNPLFRGSGLKHKLEE